MPNLIVIGEVRFAEKYHVKDLKKIASDQNETLMGAKHLKINH